MTEPGAPTRGTVTFLFTRHRGLDAARAGARPRRATTALRERHREILRAAIAAPRRRRAGHRGRLVLRRLPRGAGRRSRPPSTASARSPPSRGRTTRRSGSGWASTPARPNGPAASLVGLDINRAARIAALAHGGQVLASEPIRAARRPPCRRRHAARPRRAPAQGPRGRSASVQVVVDGLPADFPPLRSLDARPNNLPTQLTTFVGRDARARRGRPSCSRRPGC